MAQASSDFPPAPPPKPTSAHASRTATPQHAISFAPPPPTEPYVPAELLNKSRHDLQALLTTPELLDALFTATHPTAASTTAALTAALEQNTGLATRVSATAAGLVGQRETAERRLLDTRAVERQWRDKEKDMYRALQPFSSPALYTRLVNAVAEAEALSEALADSFVDGAEGGGDVAEFVKEYRGIRKTFHLRKERKERWDEGRVGGWR